MPPYEQGFSKSSYGSYISNANHVDDPETAESSNRTVMAPLTRLSEIVVFSLYVAAATCKGPSNVPVITIHAA